MCLIESSGNDQNYIDCFYFVILNKLSFFFKIILLSLYVVNDIVYMFEAKYISFKRIIIEFLMEGIYWFIDHQLIDNKISDSNQWLLYINVLLIIIIILDMFYYAISSYHYGKDEVKGRHVISKKMFQISAVVIIMMGISQLILNSFNYHSLIQVLFCLLTGVYLSLEALTFVDENKIFDVMPISV